MHFNEEVQNAFDEWFYEMEGFSFRSERFYDDIEYEDVAIRNVNAKRWLQSAFEVGYNAGKSLYGGTE